MRNKALTIATIISGSAFLLCLIVTFSLAPAINVDEIIAQLKPNGGQINNDYWNLIEKNVDDPFSLAYFSLGFFSFNGMIKIGVSSVFGAFVLFLVILLPISSIFIFFFGGIFCYKILIDRTKQYRYDEIRNINRFIIYIAGISAIVFLLIGFLIFLPMESNLKESGLLTAWDGTHNDKVIVNTNLVHVFEFITALKFMFGSTMTGILSPGINDQLHEIGGAFANSNINESQMIAGLVFLIILTPISSILAINAIVFRFGAMYSNKSYQEIEHFHNWLDYRGIYTRREFREMIFHNVWFWVAVAGFGISVLAPGVIHSYSNPSGYIVTVVVLVIAFLTFIPTIVQKILINKIFKLSQHKIMFYQQLLLIVVGIIIQLVLWIGFKDIFNYPETFAVFIPITSITIGLISLTFFIKTKI
ncbi:motility-associated protein Scm1 [Spiroplasma endosymbiont of Panorpa germanica]|uniref:motility-associated protein Scm1 n=1 Tax=Spiroplasma endosymbiont of Panorpa germanica TaxID=3066314 RepID=UPI0030D47CD1